MFHDLLYRLRALLHRQTVEQEMEEELRLHLERQTEKNLQTGMPLGEARRHALASFGGTEQTREACRDARGTRWLEESLRDCRYALRLLWKYKVFSTLVVSVLALGIGANTAVFSIVHAVLLKPLPFRDSSSLLAVWNTYLPQFSKVGISPSELQSWQSQHDLFTESAWYRYVPLDGNLAVAGAEPLAIHSGFISANLFSLLGTSPLRGRVFSRTEDPHSALLSQRLWRSRFRSNPQVVGRTFRFNGELFTVIGVMPAAAQFPEWTDLWLPDGPLLGDQLTNPVRHALGFLARLRPGVDQNQATVRLVNISRRLARQNPKTSTGWGIRVNRLQDDLTADRRPALLLLMGAAIFLLLIACANAASLLLSKASGRKKEIAIRSAVGATSGRIVRQLVTESLLLAAIGGALGWLLAKSALLAALRAPAHLDPAVLLFLFAITFATGLIFGLAPAVAAFRTNPQASIKSASSNKSGVLLRSALVVFEFALTLTLVIGAGLLARSFFRLMQVNPGFDANGVLTLRILTPPSRKPELLFHRMQEKLLPLPGIQSLALTNALPLIADRANTLRFNIPGSPLINPDALPAAQMRTASAAYFSAMQIPLQSGRVFTERDSDRPVVIVNQAMAARFWPAKNPVGIKFITGPWGPHPAWSTIIGVVADVKQFGLDSSPSLDLYFPSLAGQYLIVKTTGDPLALAPVVEATLHSIDPELAISDVRSMNQIAAESARARRWTMALLVSFAALAFLLALAGIYGVMSWSVAQRNRELGIRIALGAQKRQVLSLVLRAGLKLALLGLALGIPASLALRHVLSTLVYGISTADPLVYAAVPATMFLVTLLACYLPARKASGVDPLLSLRCE